ncbi:unnamed protein product [Durusdinium trenchii]|uniref:Uncharacterized protein n=1 Tax=Durusdinium trenchii TaxID=1381693 RepID=A0ABP0PL91_9DINO
MYQLGVVPIGGVGTWPWPFFTCSVRTETKAPEGRLTGLVAYNAAISACEKAGLWEAALCLLRDISRLKLSFNGVLQCSHQRLREGWAVASGLAAHGSTSKPTAQGGCGRFGRFGQYLLSGFPMGEGYQLGHLAACKAKFGGCQLCIGCFVGMPKE